MPRLLILTLLASILGGGSVQAAKHWTYFGTYTGGKGAVISEGIYRSSFDDATGELSAPELAAKTVNPSFLAIAPDNRTLYSVGEEATGSVRAFRLDTKTGQLTPLNRAETGGGGCCHLTVHPSGQLLAAANYGGGSCAFFRLQADGSIGERIAFFQHEGKGPNAKRQEKPHAHCTAFDPSGKFAFVVDLGIDQVKVYSVDAAAGRVQPAARPFFALPPGSGPRHIAITPAGDWAFVNGELDCTVNVVKMDVAAGKYEVVQSLSTLRPGEKVTPKDSTAEVRIAPTGKHVYVSNRGHDTVAIFGWDGQQLTPQGHVTGAIRVPRNFTLDSTGRWMLVANQEGASVAVFRVMENGQAQATGSVVTVGKPICVRLVAQTE